MNYVHLGRSGLKVSRLCLGTMNFGPLASETESFVIMDRALELGINFFDTADVYGWETGEGITEQILGRWFAQGGGRREKVVLATKIGKKFGKPWNSCTEKAKCCMWAAVTLPDGIWPKLKNWPNNAIF
jgi:aryl-alcohol dehydrogenase-like predicted oxidoreductase